MGDVLKFVPKKKEPKPQNILEQVMERFERLQKVNIQLREQLKDSQSEVKKLEEELFFKKWGR
jgi:predicted nuclease with TOPRIM domain